MPGSILSRRARLPIFLGLLALALATLYPVYMLLITSLRTKVDYLRDPFGIPKEWTLENFRTIWVNYGAGHAFMNSVIVVCTALTITVVLATLAGYSLAKLNPPGAAFFSRAFVSMLLIPAQVLLLPIYLMLSRLHLVGQLPGLMFVYIAVNLPFATFFMSISFKSMPEEIIEAARMDGAGLLRTIRSVVVPMSAGAIATMAVLQFMSMWNELLFAYILLPDETKRLLTPALSRIGDKYLAEQPLVAAGLLIAALVPITLLALSSRFLIRGVSMGAVK